MRHALRKDRYNKKLLKYRVEVAESDLDEDIDEEREREEERMDMSKASWLQNKSLQTSLRVSSRLSPSDFQPLCSKLRLLASSLSRGRRRRAL